MASTGEESFWVKLAKDLTTLRISTIVAKRINGGEVPPEPAVMLWEIAQEFDECLAQAKAKGSALSGTERDILSRIETSCGQIGRLYATIDERAAAVQAVPEVARYQAERLKGTEPADAAALRTTAWAGTDAVDRVRFAQIERHCKALLAGTPIEWEEEAAAEAATSNQPPSAMLVPSSWPIMPKRLAAPEDRGLEEAAARNSGYQAACRRLFRLEPDEVVVLRKIWEIGTDVVLMETVIQLDGDVISRVRQGHDSDPNLQGLHRSLLETALNNWHFLVDTIGKFIDRLGQLIQSRP